MIARQSQLYTDRCKLSNTLKDLKEGPELKKAVDRIAALTSEYNDLAEQKKQFEKTGAFPDPAKAVEKKPIDKAELIQAIANCRSRLSKARAAVKKDPANTIKATKVEKIQAELQDLEKSLQTL